MDSLNLKHQPLDYNKSSKNMNKVITAIFDGETLHPEVPLDLTQCQQKSPDLSGGWMLTKKINREASAIPKCVL